MTVDIHHDRILIVDFGSQYTQLIARRIRELGVYCELMSPKNASAVLKAFSPRGIILSGGPESVTQCDLRIPDEILKAGVPLLGICYGMQSMAVQCGGAVARGESAEFGYARVNTVSGSVLFEGIADEVDAEGRGMLDVWMSHGDRVSELPEGFSVIGETDEAPIAAMANEQRQWYGLQFHPEVTHTKLGKKILSRFVLDICACAALWTPDNIIEESIKTIRERVGDDRVLVALSGGVDSAVVASLLHRAIGDQLHCFFVDTGLMRENEVDEVMSVFDTHYGVEVRCIDARNTFLSALRGVTDPEEKRKICGEQFIRVFEQAAADFSDVKYLAQGTIYPDVIESAKADSGAHVIKSHHNVGGLPDHMNFELIEPLRELFKDEVRTLGMALGLPKQVVYRHPFPGPGLALRVLGEVNEKALAVLRQADRIFIEALRAADLYDAVSQAFAVFLPIKSVGVKGDARSYEYVIALRAVTTVDFMTAQWADLPYAFLSDVSHRIINSISAVSRVVYDISGKPPATIEWE